MTVTVPETSRLEIKFVSYEINRPAIERWLGAHRANFGRPYAPRSVNNVYFDTWAYGAFAENLSGVRSRTKIRFRWYGPGDGIGAGTLEIKRKRNYFGWKERFRIEHPPYQRGWTWRAIRTSLLDQLPAAARPTLLAHPLPVMMNRYDRDYFVSHDGKIRATVDSGQTVWDQRFKPRPNFRYRANLPRTLVVEFKFERPDRDLASQVLQGLPVRVSRHSKYVNAVRAISGR